MSFISRSLRSVSINNLTTLSSQYKLINLNSSLSPSILRRLSSVSQVCNGCSVQAKRSMHILQYKQGGKQCIGVRIDKEHLLSVSDSAPDLPRDVCSALRNGPQVLVDAAKKCLESSTEKIPIKDVELLPPITNPTKVVCIGLNYRDHCAEVGKDIPQEPLVFSKFSDTITRSGEIQIPPVTKCLDYECELVIVVGKKAKNVSESEAMGYVFGYTAANDVSARDMVSDTKNGGQFLLAKSLDNFCPLADDIVTKEELTDVHNLNISTKVNDEVRQKSNTNQIIFTVPKLINYLSGLFTLLPGDIILTGTPGDVGMGMKPPNYLKSGDSVTVEIEKIGTVVNRFV